MPTDLLDAAVDVPARSDRHGGWILPVLLAASGVFIILLLFVGIQGDLGFALRLRGTAIAAMAIVAAAVSASTVVFHTITDNRILTPSIMGFEALFVAIQTLLVFAGGLGGLFLLPAGSPQKFLVETALMMGFATALFGWLFSGRRTNLQVLLMAGVIFGILFQSIAVFMQRALAPNEFDILQARTIGGFSKAVPALLPWAATGLAACLVFIWSRRRTLDVLALGRDTAISLGVNHGREVRIMLAVVSCLVAISTALVGPLTFFGFLAATLAYQLTGTTHHARTLPMAFAVGFLALTCGQFVLQYIAPVGALSIVIEFAGGALFLSILFGRRGIQ